MSFATFFGDVGSLCSMSIFFMILAIILANKLTPADTKGQVAAKGIEALIRSFFGRR